MKPKILIAAIFLAMAVVLPGMVAGKNENTQRQSVKEEKSTNNPKTDKEDKNSKNNISNNQSETEKNTPSNAEKNSQAKNKKEVKIGAPKLKEILNRLSTDSAKFATGEGKLWKIHKVKVEKNASISSQLKRHAVSGIIQDLTAGLITLSHQTQTERVYQINYNSDTLITGKASEASDSASLASTSAKLGKTSATLAVGQRITAVGELLPAGGIMAKRIHIIPGKAVGVFKKNPVATSSSSVTPTLNATPSATTTLTPPITLTPTTIPSDTDIP